VATKDPLEREVAQLTKELKNLPLAEARERWSQIVDEVKEVGPGGLQEALLKRNAHLASALREAEVPLWIEIE